MEITRALSFFQPTRTRRMIVLVLVLGVIIVCLAFWVRHQVSLCNEQCQFLYEPTLEENVGEEQTFVKKDIFNGGMSVSYTAPGFLRTATVNDDAYTFEFSDFVERTSVSGSIPAYSFTIPVTLCSESVRTELDKLVSHRTQDQINEFVTLDVTYSVDGLSFWGKVRFVWDKFVASVGDKSVDLSDFARVTSAEYSAVDKAALVETCTQTASAVNTLEVGTDVYNAVAGIMKNTSLGNAGGVEPFFTYGWFSCDSCGNGCHGKNEGGIGLDYLFYPMLGASLEERDAHVDVRLARDVLAASYLVDQFPSFSGFVNSSECLASRGNPGSYWGTEPICMPYLIAKTLGEDGISAQVYKKICFDISQEKINVHLSARETEENPFTDDVFFSYIDRLFSDYEAFQELPLLAERDMHPTHGFVFSGMDYYIYGYEIDDDGLISAGNEHVLPVLWDVVHQTEAQGVENAATQLKVRKALSALIVKRALAPDEETKSKVDIALSDLVAFAGGDAYLADLYDMKTPQLTFALDTQERYLKSLGDLIPIWVLAPDFYGDHFEKDMNEYVSDWFYGHYLSSDCGKADGGYFVNYNSDGSCLEHTVGIRSNLTTALYLLMIADRGE